MLDEKELKGQLQAVAEPAGAARGLPNTLYDGEAGFDLERRKIFHNGWACVASTADVPNPGDAAPISFLGAPLLLVRDHDGDIRLFQNVCRHRGMILVEEKRNFTGVIRCPYHSWCYSLDGRLRATPHAGGPGQNRTEAFDPAETGLIEVKAGVFLETVFADLSGNAGSFDNYIAPLRARWAEFADRAVFHGGETSRFTLDVNCNWKLAVENYCESYHLPWVHPGLNAYSRLEDHYNIEEPRVFSGQGTVVYNPSFEGCDPFPDFEGLSSKWDTGAEYLALYPNVLFGVHRDHVYSIRLEPVAHNRLREHIDIFYADEAAATSSSFAEIREKNAAQWKEIFVEDIVVVEGMQKGRLAPGFDGGVFAPAMDSPTMCFHDYVARKLK